MRLFVVHLGADKHQIIWSFHHLLLDGWSLQLILKEVTAFYEAELSEQKLELSPVRPYGEYIAWLQQQDLSQAEQFWRQTLKGFAVPTTLRPIHEVRRLLDQEQGLREHAISLSETTTAALQTLARRHRLTLSTIIQGAWALLLSRYSGQKIGRAHV